MPGANNAYLRGFFTSNLWFQEIYAYFTPGPYLKAKIGKIYRDEGIFWDDSFFGNIQYFDGLKLNPDYGVAAEGQDEVTSLFAIAYDAQFFLQSDGINGGLDYARTLGDAPPMNDSAAARAYSPNPEGQLDSAGNRAAAFRNAVVLRVAGDLHPSESFGVTLGVSGSTAEIDRASAIDLIDDRARVDHAAVDLTARLGPILAYGEYLRQWAPATRAADYVLAGARAALGPVQLRFNASWVHYHLNPGISELILQPGVTYAVGGGLSLLLEYDEWQRKDPRTDSSYQPYDRSLSFVALYSY